MVKIRTDPITIGILPGWQAYTGTLDTFLSNVFRGIQTAGLELKTKLLFGCGVGPGYGLGLGRTAWPIHSENVDYIPIGPWNCDGLIVIPPMASKIGISYFQGLYDSGYPLVFAGSAPINSGVIADNEGGIRQALLHLMQHGHRKIAFISGREHDVDSDSAARYTAYTNFIEEFGLGLELVLIEPGNHTYLGGVNAMVKILARKAAFSAVLASNDQSATGAMDVLRDQGFLIPNDIAVVGFDNRTEAKTQIPLLTTVRYPMFELGYQALNLLIRWINNNERSEHRIRIPTHLVIRESCGCSPGKSIKASKVFKKIFSGYSLEKGLHSVESFQKAITDAAFSELQYLSYQEVNYLCVRLFDALIQSINQNDQSPFYQTLQQLLDYTNTQDEDLDAWKNVISFLWNHQNELLVLLHSEDTKEQTQKLFDLAHLEISEVTRGYAARLQLQSELLADQLGQMTTLFLSAQEEEHILTALQSILPQIGIQSATIGIYESAENDPARYTNIYSKVKINLPGEGNIFSTMLTRNFPISEATQFNCYSCLVILPLKIEDGSPGFVAFNTSNFGPLSLIARQIAAAWRSIKLFHQVTEARALAEQRRLSAEEANRIKSRFLSMVSHELRTPLNLIAGLADMLLRENDPKSEVVNIARQDLERINISAQHLDGLIRDVLDLTRLDIGQIHLSCEQLEISEVLQSVNIIGKQLSEDKNLNWKYELQPHLPAVWGDKIRLRQVILNLVSNAIKFTAHGEVVLAASESGGKIIISVRDTGLGIPVYEHQYIFDEFRQSERSSARGYGGLGLGLSICKKLVDMHGGDIIVFSEGVEDKGSTFSLTLPVMDAKSNAKPFSEYLPDGSHVLILVSDINAGKVVKQHLEIKGHRVELKHVQENVPNIKDLSLLPPDVILLDLGMASEQGWNLLQILKNNPATKDISVLFFSLAQKEGSGTILDLDFEAKPLTTNTLSQVLEKSGLFKPDQIQDEKTIMIVDDDPGIIELHARLINNLSPKYQICRALNGNQALQILKNKTIDLVILDLLMPEMDGFSVLQTMRTEESSRNIPVIVVTGQSLTDEDIKKLNLGVSSVLGKGIYTVQETLEHITNAMKHKKSMGLDVQQRVLQALAYIHRNYTEHLSRTDIARHVGLSERHLNRCFQQELNLSPIVYLNRYRIKQAKILLETGHKDITAIAMDIGFTSSSYFTRVFREEVGVSPRKYFRCQD